MTLFPFPLFLMHYCVFVLVPQDGDIDINVAKALAPFADDLIVKPYKRHFSPAEIQAMARYFKLKTINLKTLVPHVEDWCGELGGIDERGLFAVSTINPESRWDWYAIGGRWNGELPGNVLSAAALLERADLKSLLPAALVTPDGGWHERETFVSTAWRQGRFERKSDRDWLIEVREALGSHPDHRVVCVDVHN